MRCEFRKQMLHRRSKQHFGGVRRQATGGDEIEMLQDVVAQHAIDRCAGQQIRQTALPFAMKIAMQMAVTQIAINQQDLTAAGCHNGGKIDGDK